MRESVMVELKQITKTFGTVLANEDVDLIVQKGEIHALLGENGAGKSTLVNMLSGIYSPDSGSIFIRGQQMNFSSPRESIACGIGMVHQHFKLVDRLTAKENIIAGNKGKIFTSGKEIEKEIMALCERYDLSVELSKRVQDMSVGEKQMLEIIKVLYRGADILILDEPTAVLIPQEVERLFNIIRRMKKEGCAVIIITHKLGEVMALCDKVTVLRKGKNAATVDIAGTNPKHLTELMVGGSVDLAIQRTESENKKPIYEINNVTVTNKEGVKALKDISFTMYTSEILGVAAVAGSGQKELCEALFGLLKLSQGELVFKGENITGKTPREIYKKGISMSSVPEDRLGMGLVGSMDIVDNLLLKEYYTQKGLFITRKPLREKARELVKRLQVSTPGIHHPVKQLSGGNIQKVLLGREIYLDPDVLITSYPVRGLDIGATYQIYDLLNEQKAKGVSVLFVGEDLDVLLNLSDRILVLCDGKITGLVDAKDTTKEEIGMMMAGHTLADVKDKGGANGESKSC
ncbi:ABC transporter ATP-binding protein [Cellulosilyticum sp. I15G10I2]|uniref:ABC transporter ATP-binding protein n=1 Tax=Cellulosilyticum sp. I15G10I2 TaxID=1892843 RepID=UPI00085C9A1D|nr:ABC transporter ATP-binding protein [Cellulosilyticum sp. I15G10I2]